MGMRLTLKSFLSHLFTEPAVALEGLTISIKDIMEILFFYFSELSLTASYVILFVLAVRFLMRKAPKVYSYALWSIVYFRLISEFKLDIFHRSLIPQAEIDTIYMNMVPDHTFFYSSEAGVVSIVQSDLMAAVPVVTPMYLPALIWSLGILAIVCVSIWGLVQIAGRTSGTKQSLKDNVYICKYISSPFVFGIITPKILLPEGLSEQQQLYVITHENVHIRRGDHIVKLFAFFITVMHWFNPLVWLSFFLLEKDMEMSCDEKVLQILGNEHKKDYSYCILSLATNKKFVPKAYLSFGDSDTQKRIKNVLDYKKPAFWTISAAVITIILVVVGMMSKQAYVAPPKENAYDRFYLTLDGYSTSVSFELPYGWSMEKRDIRLDEYPDYLTIDDNFSDAYDIYDRHHNNVGAMGFASYTEQIGEENNLMAIYGPAASGNMYSFDLGEEYYAVNKDENGYFEAALTKVYHSPQLNKDMGYDEATTYGNGILGYSRECTGFVAFEFDQSALSDYELNRIAKSLTIKPEDSSFGVATVLLSAHYRNLETGSNFDISPYVTDEVLALLNAKKEIAHHRLQAFGIDKQSLNVQVVPFEKENWVETENTAYIKMQVLRTYRYNTANFDSSTSEVISLRLDRNTNGDFIITDYRLYGKDLTFNDMDSRYWQAVFEGKGEQFLEEFVEEYKSFLSNISSKPNIADKSNMTPFPVTKEWQFSIKCAATSSEDKYVITYCDEKISCSTGLLTIENKNDFDIDVHLVSSNNGEFVLNVPQNTSAAFAMSEKDEEYVVGVHADVKEDTEINFTIYENEHVSELNDND